MAEIEDAIKEVDEQIKGVESEIQAAERKAGLTEIVSERDYWRQKETQLRQEKAQLRQKEAQLRQEKAQQASKSSHFSCCCTLSWCMLSNPIHFSMHAVCWPPHIQNMCGILSTSAEQHPNKLSVCCRPCKSKLFDPFQDVASHPTAVKPHASTLLLM